MNFDQLFPVLMVVLAACQVFILIYQMIAVGELRKIVKAMKQP